MDVVILVKLCIQIMESGGFVAQQGTLRKNDKKIMLVILEKKLYVIFILIIKTNRFKNEENHKTFIENINIIQLILKSSKVSL